MSVFEKLIKMKILLIDDDEWIRDSMSLFFETEGCHITTLETAEEGIKELKRQDHDIIIVDYRLPGKDGLEFLKRIGKSHSKVIKILITAFEGEKVVSEAKEIGVQDLIQKPFTTDTIEESLSKLVGA